MRAQIRGVVSRRYLSDALGSIELMFLYAYYSVLLQLQVNEEHRGCCTSSERGLTSTELARSLQDLTKAHGAGDRRLKRNQNFTRAQPDHSPCGTEVGRFATSYRRVWHAISSLDGCNTDHGQSRRTTSSTLDQWRIAFSYRWWSIH